jgi:hypothetical protein
MTTILFCEKCLYSTNNKYDFNRHLSSIKHNANNCDDNYKYVCICNKKYKNCDGLWKHKKKCPLLLQQEQVISEKESDVAQLADLVKTLLNQNIKLQQTISEENKEHIEENKEFRETIVSMQPQVQTINNMNTTNNNINNTFNLNLFLNETCKDAMNIDDFIDSIEISIQDLKHLGKKGYVEGLSDLFIKNLEELDIAKRPLHCSDLKRETVHIRDKNKWEKENDQINRLTKVMTDIARLNTRALQNEYQKLYPNCLTDYKSKEHEEYGKIAYEAFGGKLDIEKANKKLFRNIMKVVAINKHMF